MFKRNFILLFIIGLSVNSYGRGGGRDSTTVRKPNERVTWIGELTDDPATHNTRHEHKLVFVRQDSGEKYAVEGSPELLKLHHETGKNYLVEIEAEKRPRFFSEYLKVSSFKVLKETSPEIPHHEVSPAPFPTMGE